MAKRYAIIVAGGSGSRMGTELPKQFLPLAGRTILLHTLETFHRFDAEMALIVVLPKTQLATWTQLYEAAEADLPLQLVPGGETRFQSVKNGLAQITEPGVVGIHDGVRPLVSLETLQAAYTEAERSGTAIPVIPLVESIRAVTDAGNEARNRDDYRLVQTPQCFQSELLQAAYQQDYRSAFTDDASVVEAAGNSVTLVPGNKENIKITTPIDLILAQALLNS